MSSTNLHYETEELFRGIGEVVVQFQQVEHWVADVLASLLQLKHEADTHRVTAAMSYGQKVDLMCDLYPERCNERWPIVNIKVTRNALKAAEEFRNAVVHSFWYVGGTETEWMRTKANLRSKSQLKVSTGSANIGALKEGADCLRVVKDWYLGESEKVVVATGRLKILTQELGNAQDKKHHPGL
ncbi:hypothetical protein [Massilia arenae]|uniref:Uncharacterized protein n=1 Tax=Massilia arenae TaxID=2603288 RepID=A0A5C7G6D1_9BURK|nr:hypothetical protein [Massilia arenae]TXG01506.1 hypothetical protein FVD38_02695 [Massilia arenae]